MSCWFSVIGQNTPIPENYSIVKLLYGITKGDLDKDGIDELAVAYNTEEEADDFNEVSREIIIYKQKDNNWTIWKKSKQVLLANRQGGMMGDPFGKIVIKNGILFINHDGGSSWKWSFTDKYRFQENDLYLIGYEYNYGKLDEYWLNVNFNLSTGKMIVKKEFERCENGVQKIIKSENEILNNLFYKIKFENRREKEIKIVTPKYKHTIYISLLID